VKTDRRFRIGVALAGVVLSLAVVAPLTGCSAAAYGLGVATMVNDSKVRQREAYESYRRQAEAENAPNVMTFRQWVRSQQNG
jgi:hypothetical protein